MRAAPPVRPYARGMDAQSGRKLELADDRFVSDRDFQPPEVQPPVESLLALVVGAHPRAEVCDRPLAARLARAIRQWQASELEPGERALVPIVCCDLWYMNDRELMRQPSVTIGDPGVNAATAYFASRLPKAYVIDDVCAVQLDAELLEPSVALWGADWRGTETAVEAFLARYLDRFLRVVHT